MPLVTTTDSICKLFAPLEPLLYGCARDQTTDEKVVMSITTDEARQLLHERSLRATAPRIAVLRVLAEAQNPLSHTEVLERLGETKWDPATIYRNLVKMRDAGVAPIASKAQGMDRYALARAQDDGHQHPHFFCEDCGHVACLPAELTASMSIEGPWAAAVEEAMVNLRGECPDCRSHQSRSPR